MSYSQFGYTYPASSQLLVNQGGGCPVAAGGGEVSPPHSVYDARMLSFPFGLYAPSTYADHISSHSAFYTALPSPFDLKESRSSWSTLQQSTAACYPYDPNGLASYPDRYGSMDSVARRKNATRETTNTLKAWLYEHRKNPYPTKGEKIMLAIITKMTLTQVSTWFANARRRLKKENKMTWEPRNKTSEGDDRDSSSPVAKSDDTMDDSNLPDYLKPDNSPTDRKPQPDHTFSLEDCYRVRPTHSSEDSGSGSPYDNRKDNPPAPFSAIAAASRPKIWSLARTATSDSPPAARRAVPDLCAPTDKPGLFCAAEKDCPAGDMKLSGWEFSAKNDPKDCPAILSGCYADRAPKDCPADEMKLSGCYRNFPDRKNCPASPLPSCYREDRLKDCPTGLSGCYREFSPTDRTGKDDPASDLKGSSCYRDFAVPDRTPVDCAAGLSGCYREFSPTDRSAANLKDCPAGDLKVSGCYRDFDRTTGSLKDCPVDSLKLPNSYRGFVAGRAAKDLYDPACLVVPTKSETTPDCLESGDHHGSCMLDVRPPPYVTDFGLDGAEPYAHFQSGKSAAAVPFPVSKCHVEEEGWCHSTNQDVEMVEPGTLGRQNDR